MNILGISAGFHDAAASVINSDGEILFAAHSERYSRNKHDRHICQGLIDEVVKYYPKVIAYHEKPLQKQLRQLYSGQGFDTNNWRLGQIVQHQTGGWFKDLKKYSFNHHLSHAAAGFQTSSFDRATVVVIDAIGEWDTTSIWAAEYVNGQAKYKKLWSQRYPHSIGLFYSAMTKRVGLKPLDEEYILMGMSAFGQSNDRGLLQAILVQNEYDIKFRNNLHLGVEETFLRDAHGVDIAASTQELATDLILNVIKRAQDFKYSSNLVYMGGVALNCVANAQLGNYFDDIWIMPNPGDAGSSLGCAALVTGRRLNFRTASLGHNIPGPFPVSSLLDELLDNKIVGVASGRAEFGPRALGNRSLLADPRGDQIKDRVNGIKRRQQFRPFAPVILEELVEDYFEMPRNWRNSRYMQVVARCKRPDLFPAIVHHDGTSRVQTVPANGSGIRKLLEQWLIMTDCPMLLNTSLNIRGEPMVNTRADADRFEKLYKVRVIS